MTCAPPDGFTADDFAIPTLADVVGAFPDIPLNVEIKGTGELAIETADALVAELTELDRLDGASSRRSTTPSSPTSRRSLPTSRSRQASPPPRRSSSTARRCPTANGSSSCRRCSTRPNC